MLDRIKYFAGHARIIKPRPVLIGRILSGYAKTLLLKQTVLRTLELTLLSECNAKCVMCYAANIKKENDEYMSVAEYRDLWKQATKLGAFSALLSGGEPTLRKEIFDIISVLDPKNSIIGMTSNASKLKREYVHELKKAGLNTLHLSLDGLTPEKNDTVRGMPGHFEMVMNAIDYAKECGLHIFLSTVIFHNGMEKMREIVDFAKKHDIGVVFSLACVSGNWDSEKDVLLSGDEWDEVQAFMRANPHIRSDWTINFSMKQECPGGREKVNISPYGEVMGCGMNFVSFGNVRDDPLERIWRRMGEFPYFKERTPNCLIGAYPEYIDKYVRPMSGKRVPISIDEHPAHPISFEDLESKIS